jgi:hypothetical protein
MNIYRGCQKMYTLFKDVIYVLCVYIFLAPTVFTFIKNPIYCEPRNILLVIK